MEENTYKQKNMKFAYSITLVTLLSVSILLYLISSGNFLPINENGDYIWLNVLFFTISSILTIGSFVTLIAYLAQIFLLKKESGYSIYASSLKWGFLLSAGLLLIFILNFFHILSLLWGLGILLVVITLAFII